MRPVLSCYQATRLLEARRQGSSQTLCSFDFERTSITVTLDEQGVQAPGVCSLQWPSVEHVASVDSVAFTVDEAGVTPLRIFSEAADRSFQLWPTPTSPALLVSGFLMHRVRDVAPDEGAARMVRALGKIHGRLLDTTSGLGYAAIAASRTATEVVTVELQPVVRELARQNPWSQPLFETPHIQLHEGDSAALVPSLAAGSFAAVLHDPPAINLAGELYSADFYAAVLRVLARRGKFFHYVGDAHSPSGSRTTRGVVKRLREAGFSRVTVIAEAFGVLAQG